MPKDYTGAPNQTALSGGPAAQFWDVIWLLWARRLVLLGVALLAAVLATVVVMTMPREYAAEATVFLTPPTYATSLRQEVMSVEAYARLAETEHILAKVVSELNRQRADLFPIRNSEKQGKLAFAARLSASREPQKPYLPLIGLRATAESPEAAKLAANVWAEMFIREEARIAAVGKTNGANFILQEYPKIERAVLDTERALEQLRGRQGRELVALTNEMALSLKTAQLQASEWRIIELEGTLARAQTQRDRLGPSVAQLEREIKATPPTVILSKAITDDALWNAQSAAAGAPKGADALAQAKLQTQEVNPVYTSLNQRLALERVDHNALAPTIASLRQQIEAMRRSAAQLRASVLEGERRVTEMERRHELEAAGLVRELDTARKSYAKLSDKVGDARIAQSEPDNDIKLGAYAELPTKPSGVRRSVLIPAVTGGAVLITALLLVAVSLVKREWLRKPPAIRPAHL